MHSRLLLYGSLPPPFTGQSAMFVPVVRSFAPGEVTVINITRFATPLPNTLWTIYATLVAFALRRFHTVYFTPSRSRMGAVKDLPLLFLGRWTGKRMIAHLHGANFRSFYESAGILRPLINYGYQNVDTAIVLMEEMRDEFIHFPGIKVHVVPNCYDSAFDSPIPPLPSPISLPPSPFPPLPSPLSLLPSIPKKEQVLYLSALMHSKGILDFLDAAGIVLEKRPWASVVVAGVPWADGSMGLKEITREVKQRLDALEQRFPGRIAYPGLVTGQAKIDLLRVSSVFVLPSWHPSEALPVSIIEAMRTGNAIVAAAHNFIPLIVGPQNGILVEPRSPRAIAEAVITLLEDPEHLKAIQEQNITQAIENHSPAWYAETIMHIIKEG